MSLLYLLDAQIAAHALAEGPTPATHHSRHFAPAAGLKLEDWSDELAAAGKPRRKQT